MFRQTGPGKVEVDAKFSSPGMIKAKLFNFDFDDMGLTVLKPEHASFLGDKVLPLLQDDRGHIWMQGSASRVGQAGYNKTLSRHRVDRVADFLAARGVGRGQMQPEAVGAELTGGHALDEAGDRAVSLVVLPKAAPKKDPPDPPPPVVPPKPAVSSQFRIAMLMALSGASWGKLAKLVKLRKLKVSVGIAVDAMAFQIWDTTNNLACIYGYLGGGAGAGISHLPPLSGTSRGPWNPFSTSSPISSSQFGGAARFTTAGVWSKSINFINLLGTPPGVDSVYLQLNTGTTYGLGASTTVGDFILLEGPDPFSGP